MQIALSSAKYALNEKSSLQIHKYGRNCSAYDLICHHVPGKPRLRLHNVSVSTFTSLLEEHWILCCICRTHDATWKHSNICKIGRYCSYFPYIYYLRFILLYSALSVGLLHIEIYWVMSIIKRFESHYELRCFILGELKKILWVGWLF